MKILEMNSGIRDVKTAWKAIERVHKQAREAYLTPIERTTRNDDEGGCTLGEAHCKTCTTVFDDYQTLLGNLNSVLPHLSLLSGAHREASRFPSLPPAYFSPASLSALLASLSKLKEHLNSELAGTADLRTKRVIGDDYLRQVLVLEERA